MASTPADNSLHTWRSKAIDGFARAEFAIDHLLRKTSLPAKGDLLSAKIDRLRKAKLTAYLTFERKNQVDALLIELAGLLPIRNDIVHAPMNIVKTGEVPYANFANPNLHCEYSRISRDISLPRFQALATKVARLAEKLETASNL